MSRFPFQKLPEGFSSGYTFKVGRVSFFFFFFSILQRQFFIGVTDLVCDYVRKLSDEEAELQFSSACREGRETSDRWGALREARALISTRLRPCFRVCVNQSRNCLRAP